MRAEWCYAFLLVASSLRAEPASAPDPSVFATGHDNHLGLTFSPDGNAAYWVAWDGAWGSNAAANRTIYTSRLLGGVWSKPRPAPFSGRYSDNDPFVSPDGNWLYFVSKRPANESDEHMDADIWRYSLVAEDRVERLAINSVADEYSPVVTRSGALYFASARAGGLGQGDIYRAAPANAAFESPAPLGSEINSATGEWNVWVSGDEAQMIFEASSRPTNVSVPGDLYYSSRNDEGWTSAAPITALNSGDSDLMPRMHPDGQTLYYTTAPIGGHARIVFVDWAGKIAPYADQRLP